LTGFVHKYGQRREAENAAKRISGVAGIANDIEVRVPTAGSRPDPEIAREAAQAIRYQLPTVAEHIQPIVSDGWITLEGEVEWYDHRQRAERAVHWLRGVKGVSNLIRLKPRVQPAEIKRKIEDAFRRNAQIDANRVDVETFGGEVTLEGIVTSWAEFREAEHVAGAAPGVTQVNNRLVVNPLTAFSSAV
jgi:osmotically-inducible protein OsmY